MGKINTWIKKLDESHLEWLGIAVILVLLAPIFLLCIRDGAGSGIFVVHDQLDETVLSYVFSVRYFGQSVYEQLMCGIDKTGLVMPSPFFMPLYAIFNVYNAFLIQYVIVVVTAFFGMYFCVRTISGSSISAFMAGALFACLPFMPIYGNVVAGTPLVVLCFLKLKDCSAKKTVLYCLLLAYYALSDHIVLTGWVALGTAGIFVLIYWIKDRKFPVKSFIAAAVLFLTYVAINFRLIIQSLLPSDVVSHRVEFRETKGAAPFWDCLKNIFLNDKAYYDANTKHYFVAVCVAVAIVLLFTVRRTQKLLKPFLITACALVGASVITAAFSSYFVEQICKIMPGILKSFQFDRVFFILPGLWYMLLGLSFAIIWEAVKEKIATAGAVILVALAGITFLSIQKGGEGIMFQNLHQLVYSDNIYVSMKSVFAESVMADIEKTIGRDMKDYRIAHIGIDTAPALLHGFYTIDGYSNNYPLEYKHTFREIIADELDLNESTKEYFDGWGSRCYLFYHEWGSSHMLSKWSNAVINDLHFNFAKMKELNCRYILSAAEIVSPESYGLKSLGYFTDSTSYWGIHLYEIE